MLIKKYLASVACAALLLAPTAASGGDDLAAKIAHAASAAPASISANATILDADGSVLRKGTNGWTCMPGVSLIAGDMHPMCNDEVWTRWLKAATAGEPFSTDVIGFSYMLMGDGLVSNDDPNATDPNDGGNWVEEGPHLMMLMPSREMVKDIPRNPYNGGPYVMWDKTPMYHVMVPLGSGHK